MMHGTTNIKNTQQYMSVGCGIPGRVKVFGFR